MRLAFVRFSVYNEIAFKEGCAMLNYISVKDTAEKWGISERRIQKLCEENRIEGVIRFVHSWMIPRDACKLLDRRKHKKQAGGDRDVQSST